MIYKIRFLVLLFCLFLFFPCHSKWEKFREDNFLTEYFELGTVKKIDNIVYVWSMIDYKKPKKNRNMSTKYYSKFDCIKKRYKLISIIEYETSMGKGRNFKYTKNVINESKDLNWFYPSEDSNDYAKIDFVCNT